MIRNTDNRGKFVFFKLGGTWDMVDWNGRLVGNGEMDDIALKSLEKSIGYSNNKVDYSKLEWELAQEVYKRITANGKNSRDIMSVLTWIENRKIQVKGKFISLFSADSS